MKASKLLSRILCFPFHFSLLNSYGISSSGATSVGELGAVSPRIGCFPLLFSILYANSAVIGSFRFNSPEDDRPCKTWEGNRDFERGAAPINGDTTFDGVVDSVEIDVVIGGGTGRGRFLGPVGALEDDVK